MENESEKEYLGDTDDSIFSMKNISSVSSSSLSCCCSIICLIFLVIIIKGVLL